MSQSAPPKSSASGRPPPLEVMNLTKSYSKGLEQIEAVSDISFAVSEGECLGLLGPNGAGKSTSIQCISGFFPPTRGKVSIHGHDVYKEPRDARKHLGVCNQEETLDDDFNVFDQLVRHASYFRIPRELARTRAVTLLERFGLSEKSKEPVENLSGGMKRRLQVARAMISEPSVLVLDEPTTGLDPEVRRALWDILVEARKKGTAILLSTHYMDEASRLCDRVAIVHKGKILDIGPTEQLIERHLGQELVVEEDRRSVRHGRSWTRPPNLEDVYLKLTGTKLVVKAS